MENQKYRLEIVNKNGISRYNLVRDIRFKDKKAKVRKVISDPQKADIFNFDLEEKAVLKKAELVSNYYVCDYLEISDLLSLEEKRWMSHEFFKLTVADETLFFKTKFEMNYIHGTTAIEGNTLTLNEVKNLLEYGIQKNYAK